MTWSAGARSRKRVYVLGGTHRRESLYESWLSEMSVQARYVDDYGPKWEPPPDAAMLVTAHHYSPVERVILAHVTGRNRVPVLVLADGIIEYRNTWQHPQLPPGVIYQPVLGHKVACVGRSQVRILESWGNLGKCELVGLPHCDRLLGRRPRIRRRDEPFRFLIMTATTPGFTTTQLARVRQSLVDVRRWLDRRPVVNGLAVRPVWRLTGGLADEVGVPNEAENLTDLGDVLQNVDAVLTTPSTAMLEGMLQGVPVALLDYNNCPHYVPAAWTISAHEQLDESLPELLAPPPHRMLYQDTVLHDALECRSPASLRMVQLAERMIYAGSVCRDLGKPLKMPLRILPGEQPEHHLPEERFDPARLYRDHPRFGDLQKAWEVAEQREAQLMQCEREIAQLEHQRAQLQGQLASTAARLMRIERHPALRPALRLGRYGKRVFRQLFADGETTRPRVNTTGDTAMHGAARGITD